MQRTTEVADKGTDEPNEPWNIFSQVPLIQFLKFDPRPIFVIDLDIETLFSTEQLNPLFVNPTLVENVLLYNDIRGTVSAVDVEGKVSHQEFWKWVKVTAPEKISSEFQFGRYCWQSTVLQSRWNVLVANLSVPSTADPSTTVIKSPADKPVDAPLKEKEMHNSFDCQSSDVDTPPASSTSGGRTYEIDSQKFFMKDSTDHDDGIPSIQQNTRESVNGGSSIQATSAIDHAPHDARTAKRNAELLAKISAFATVAIYIVDIEGEILFCNDSWYEISNHPRHQTNAMTWVNVFEDDEVPRVMEIWRRVAIEQEPIQFQARLKRRWKPSAAFASAPKDFPTWINAWTYPDVSDGKTIGACGVMTDISEQKWSERLIQGRLSDAVERARLSEQVSISAKQAADSERRFRSLADMMPVGIWMSDISERIFYANDVYFEIIPGSRVHSKLDWAVVLDEDMSRVREAYRQVVEDRMKCSFEIRLVRPIHDTDEAQQKDKWISVSMYPELGTDGQLKYLVGCLIDISSLKLAERIQGLRASDALEAKRQLEGFIDMTSHEMRNPLGAIIHSAEDILSSFQSLHLWEISADTIANAVEAAQTIIYCTEHSTRIVDDILLVSKLEAGLLEISPSVVQPVRSLKKALSMFNGEMKAADISQSLKVGESFKSLEVDYVHMDMSRVLQVFVNLITNAIKFTRPEHIRQIDVSIDVSLEAPISAVDIKGINYLNALFEPSKTITNASVPENQTVYISIKVRDSGCGLTEVEQKKLFQRFAQAGKRTHIKYGGTGLGLYISRQLCEMHGGRIGLRSAPMSGSTFAFFVRAQKALPHEVPADDKDICAPPRQSRRISASTIATTVTSLPARPSEMSSNRNNSQDSVNNLQEQHTILLVEDNLVNQKVVAKKLRIQGYTVLVANHGLEALDHVRASSLCLDQPEGVSSISLILLDLEMPIMDGLTCIHELREMEASGKLRYHVPVIAVTANARQEQIEQAKEAGMDDVVTKPFRINQLASMMTRLMKQFPTSEAIVT